MKGGGWFTCVLSLAFYSPLPPILVFIFHFSLLQCPPYGMPLISHPISVPLFSIRCLVLEWCVLHKPCQLEESQNNCCALLIFAWSFAFKACSSLCGVMWSTAVAGSYLPCSRHITQNGLRCRYVRRALRQRVLLYTFIMLLGAFSKGSEVCNFWDYLYFRNLKLQYSLLHFYFKLPCDGKFQT